jgi:tripartite-type tricarboxylate transporter receptor subunit TctC
MKRVLFGLLTVLLLTFTFPAITFPAEQKPFYEGKTITMISWPATGGSTDLAARLYARHLPRFIPGSPEMLVRVMSGAGGVVAANYMYELAKPDGLTLWLNEPPLALTQLSGEGGARFDMLGYTYIGAIEKQTQLALLRGDLPFDTIKKAPYGERTDSRCGKAGRIIGLRGSGSHRGAGSANKNRDRISRLW